MSEEVLYEAEDLCKSCPMGGSYGQGLGGLLRWRPGLRGIRASSEGRHHALRRIQPAASACCIFSPSSSTL